MGNNALEKKNTLIFDMDGTLYQFTNGSFQSSGLQKNILKRARLFVKNNLNKSDSEVDSIMSEIDDKYGEDISLALEDLYSIDRQKYFNFTWDLPASDFIKYDPVLAKRISVLVPYFNLILLSDAPNIWITRVLQEMELQHVFCKFSGEGDIRKGLGNAFDYLVAEKKIIPQHSISFGDQLHTDILPAKKLGFKTVLVSQNVESCSADLTVKDLKSILFRNKLQEILK